MSSSKKEFSSVWKYFKRGDFVIFLIGLIIGFVALHIVYFPAAARIGELEEQVNSLEEHITSLNNDLDDRDAQIANLQSEVQNKTAQIGSLQSEISASEAEISDLEAQIAESEGEIATLRSQIAGFEQEIAAKNNMISDLEHEIEDLEFVIFNLELRPEVFGPYFSPKTGAGGGCEREIIRWIDRASTSIHVLIFSFSSDPIAIALINAYNRGVQVRVVFEEGNTGGAYKDAKLRTAGISVRTDTNTRYMHNKVMIVDGEIVITGSCDYSETAEIFNNENLIVIKSTSIGSAYEAEFSKIWGQSTA